MSNLFISLQINQIRQVRPRHHQDRTRIRGPTHRAIFGLFSVLLFFLGHLGAANEVASSWDPATPQSPRMPLSPGGQRSPAENHMEFQSAGSSQVSQESTTQAPRAHMAMQRQAILEQLNPGGQALLLDFIAIQSDVSWQSL